MVTTPLKYYKYQHGSALLIILAMVMLAFTAALAGVLPALNRATRAANNNAVVLAQAKAGLIAYALSQGANATRPGDLPCPDTTPDGNINNGAIPAGGCGNAAGTTGQAARLGRLPWKGLNLPDLRDASGQRLWYAVSNSYKANTRRVPLNSDTGFGTITIRRPDGSIQYNGTNPGGIPSGAIAVIIAPGEPIKRQDGITQIRSGTPAASAYLDNLNGVEDNANFTDQNAVDGFIQGPITDASGNIIINDQMVVITYDDLMPLIEQRVARDALQEILSYRTIRGAFPIPAAFNDPTCAPDPVPLGTYPTPPYVVPQIIAGCASAVATTNCGRIPVNPAFPWPALSLLRGQYSTDDWFQRNGWRELVFYTVAPSQQAGATLCGAAGQLSITPAPSNTSAAPNIIVTAAGYARPNAIPPQVRGTGTKTIITNYLESNPTGASPLFTTQARSLNYNDTVAGAP